MIIATLENGTKLGEWKNYNKFFNWLIASDYGVVDYQKSFDDFKRDGGTVIMGGMDATYLQKLHVKEG